MCSQPLAHISPDNVLIIFLPLLLETSNKTSELKAAIVEVPPLARALPDIHIIRLARAYRTCLRQVKKNDWGKIRVFNPGKRMGP